MKTRIDFVRLLGLALVAAAIALYARDCGRRQTEQTALLAVRAAASDPGALVAFLADDPKNPGSRLFRPVLDPAVASNIVAALAATEPGWESPRSSLVADHDVMLLGADRRSAFFRLHHEHGCDRVAVRLLAGPPPAEPLAGVPPMSAAGLADILTRIENGEGLSPDAGIGFFPKDQFAVFTNVWPAAAGTDPAAALRAAAALPVAHAEIAPAAGDGAPTEPFRALDPAAATNLVTALAAAEPVEFPGGTREGDLWQLRLFAGKNELYILQAAVLEERPADAFVGFLALPAPGATNVPARLSAPALVPGLGGFLKAR